MTISRQQITLLIILTLVWGFNWPMLKLGVSEFPPLSFRSLSMWLGLPFLGLVLYFSGHVGCQQLRAAAPAGF